MMRADTSLFIVGIAAMSYYGERHIAPGYQLLTSDSSCSRNREAEPWDTACLVLDSFTGVLQ